MPYNFRNKQRDDNPQPRKKRKSSDNPPPKNPFVDNFIEEDSDDSFEEDSDGEDSFIDDLHEEKNLRVADTIYESVKSYGVPFDVVRTAVEKAIFEFADATAENLVETSWKKNLDEKEIQELEPSFKKLREEIKNEHPTIAKILRANMTESEKKKCFQMYDIMESYDPGTSEYYEMQDKLIDHLRRAKSTSYADIEKLEKEEKRLTDQIGDIDSLKKRILNLDAPDDIKTTIYGNYLKLQTLNPSGDEFGKLKSQIEWKVSIPYNKFVEENVQNSKKRIAEAQKKLDKKLFGLNNVKTELLVQYNNSIVSPNAKKSIALCGPSGCGKTAIAKAFAESIGYPFEHISLGGAKDSTLFFGSDDVYIGAGPGIIIQILKRMKCSNGIILLDEVDKLGATKEGMEIQYALLHISDYVQNTEFRDKYLSDIKVDISKLWFFYSLNDETMIDTALLSRLCPIRVNPYTFSEKVTILKDYALPEALEKIGMKPGEITFTPEAINKIIHMKRDVSDSQGLRPMKAVIEQIVSRVNFYKMNSSSKTLLKNLNFKIDNFELPLKITSKMIDDMVEGEKLPSYINSMYI